MTWRLLKPLKIAENSCYRRIAYTNGRQTITKEKAETQWGKEATPSNVRREPICERLACVTTIASVNTFRLANVRERELPERSPDLSHRTHTQACINIASNCLPVFSRHKQWPLVVFFKNFKSLSNPAFSPSTFLELLIFCYLSLILIVSIFLYSFHDENGNL